MPEKAKTLEIMAKFERDWRKVLPGNGGLEMELGCAADSDESSSSSSRGRFDSALLTRRAAISWAFCLASRMLSSSFRLALSGMVSELAWCSSTSPFMAVESLKLGESLTRERDR